MNPQDNTQPPAPGNDSFNPQPGNAFQPPQQPPQPAPGQPYAPAPPAAPYQPAPAAMPQYQQPGMMPQQQVQDPGKGMAIASLILWFLALPLIGLIFAILSRKKTKQAGLPSETLATVALVLNIVSLVAFMTVIPILVLTTYTGIQQKARNTKREVDIQSIQTQVEAFYSQKGYYPSLSDMNNGSWRASNLPNIDTNSLADPSNLNTTTLAPSPAAKTYAYQVTDKNGASCESNDTTCAKYTLTATYEGSVDGTTTFSKSSLN